MTGFYPKSFFHIVRGSRKHAKIVAGRNYFFVFFIYFLPALKNHILGSLKISLLKTFPVSETFLILSHLSTKINHFFWFRPTTFWGRQFDVRWPVSHKRKKFQPKKVFNQEPQLLLYLKHNNFHSNKQLGFLSLVMTIFGSDPFDLYYITNWVAPFAFHNWKFKLFGTSEWNIYTFCDKPDLKSPQNIFKIHTPSDTGSVVLVHIAKIFPRGVWSLNQDENFRLRFLMK